MRNYDDPDSSSADVEEALMDHTKSRYPFSVVWTPIPILTWIFPILGHMGIALSSGVICDFAGPYYVSEDNMAFGKPTKYWQLNPEKVPGGRRRWDSAVNEASEIYKGRMHNLCCDNCHSHVATALNLMEYEGSTSWNMVWLCLDMLLYSRYVSFFSAAKTWLPFLLIFGSLTVIMLSLHSS